MLHILALLAATSVEPIVSTAWLQAHLTDPQIRIVYTGDRGVYDRGICHVRLEPSLECPGRRFGDRVVHDELRVRHELDVPEHVGTTHGVGKR